MLCIDFHAAPRRVRSNRDQRFRLCSSYGDVVTLVFAPPETKNTCISILCDLVSNAQSEKRISIYTVSLSS